MWITVAVDDDVDVVAVGVVFVLLICHWKNREELFWCHLSAWL
jgi:hypothetical protein